MKVDLTSINREHFMVHQHYIGEHECYLVQPTPFGTVWNKENLIYRSSLWDKEGTPISLSFKKFFNMGEKPDLFPAPSSLKYARLMEKLDGSTLIFSKYKGHLVVRTRGTVDARVQPNGNEVDFLLNKYPKFKSFLDVAHNTESFIFEWITPTNRIVLDYGDEPDMVLIGVVYHDNYDMMSQAALDSLSESMNLRRPKIYSYDSIEDMKKSVTEMRDQEGVCLYYNGDQDILKIKSAHYLFLHRAKSEVSSIDKVIDVYMDWVMETKKYDYVSFFNYISRKFDFEIAAIAHGHANKITKAMKVVLEIMDGLFKCADDCRHLTRKEAAAKILELHGATGRAAIVFKILDNKPIGSDEYKKILYQVLK
jgi:hypothetical protein